jgi:hypothetical protein
MPPKVIRIRPKANRGLINQNQILVPTSTINNNDGSVYSTKINKEPTDKNSKNKKEILIISAGVIVIIFLMCKK